MADGRNLPVHTHQTAIQRRRMPWNCASHSDTPAAFPPQMLSNISITIISSMDRQRVRGEPRSEVVPDTRLRMLVPYIDVKDRAIAPAIDVKKQQRNTFLYRWKPANRHRSSSS